MILGTVDLAGYCRSLGDSGVSLDGTTGYSWRCVTPSGQHDCFSVTIACRWQYNDPLAEDHLINYYDPSSWQCFSHASLLGWVTDLNGYCRSQGDQGASLDGATAYDWRCVTSAGQHVGLDMTVVCFWLYQDSQLLTRMADFNNSSSWQCWG